MLCIPSIHLDPDVYLYISHNIHAVCSVKSMLFIHTYPWYPCCILVLVQCYPVFFYILICFISESASSNVFILNLFLIYACIVPYIYTTTIQARMNLLRNAYIVHNFVSCICMYVYTYVCFCLSVYCILYISVHMCMYLLVLLVYIDGSEPMQNDQAYFSFF